MQMVDGVSSRVYRQAPGVQTFLLMCSAHYFAEKTLVAEVSCKPALMFRSSLNEFDRLFPRQCVLSRRWEPLAL